MSCQAATFNPYLQPPAPPSAPPAEDAYDQPTVQQAPPAEAYFDSRAELLERAEILAYSILPLQVRERRRPQRPYAGNVFAPINVIHNSYGSNRPANRREQEKDNRIFIGVIAFITFVAGAFFAGRAIADNEDAGRERREYNLSKGLWLDNRGDYPIKEQNRINAIVSSMDSIYQRRANNRMQNTALLIATFVAAGAAFAGAILASKALMSAGLMIGAGTLVVGMLVLGYRSFSYGEWNDAQLIARCLRPKVFNPATPAP